MKRFIVIIILAVSVFFLANLVNANYERCLAWENAATRAHAVVNGIKSCEEGPK